MTRRVIVWIVAAHGVAALPATAAPGPEISSGGALDLRAPTHLLLGDDQGAEISLRDPGQPVELVVNAGSLSPPRSDGAGRLVSSYTPPRERHPQIAVIVAMTADGSVIDRIALSLHGRPRVKIVSRPRVDVVVRVGEREFGPVRTDRGGHARLDLEVPPGIDVAETIATDDAGNTRLSQLALGAAPFSRIVVACEPGGARAIAAAVERDGTPAVDAAIAAHATPGTAGPVTPLAPGVYAVGYTPPERAAPGDVATVRVGIQGDPTSEAACALPIPGEAPTAARAVVDRASYVAGTGGALAISVQLDYPGKRPPIEVPITITADLGRVTRARALSPTEHEAAWTIPDRFGDARRAIALVDVGGPAPLRLEVQVELVPGAPARIVATAEDGSVTGDGRAGTTLVAKLVDAHGNVVRAARLSGRARGNLGGFAARPDGSFVARYTAPRSYAALVDPIVIRDASGVEAPVTVRIDPVRRPIGAAARFGVMTNFGKISAPVVLGDVQVRLPIWNGRVLVGVEAGWFRGGTTEAAEGGEAVSLEVSGAPLVARAMLQQGVGPLDLQAGAAIGALFAESRVASATAGMEIDRDTLLTFGAFARVGLRLGRGALLVEGAWMRAEKRAGAARGNIGGLFVSSGYAYEF